MMKIVRRVNSNGTVTNAYLSYIGNADATGVAIPVADDNITRTRLHSFIKGQHDIAANCNCCGIVGWCATGKGRRCGI